MLSKGSKQVLISSTSSSARSFSEILVKPLKSENKIVTLSNTLASAFPFSFNSFAISDGKREGQSGNVVCRECLIT